MNLIPSIPFTNPATNSLQTINNAAEKSALQEMDASTLEAVGRDFESIFYSMMLKEMRNSIDSTGEGGLFAGEKSDTLGSLFDLYMSQHLASSNSLGLSQAVTQYLANQPRTLESTTISTDSE
jgi:Rod binding domain-containing protein